MPSKEETRSSACLGAWCFRCQVLGKPAKESYLNYHPTRNFKAISRHFKRHHADLQDVPGDEAAAARAISAATRTAERKRSIHTAEVFLAAAGRPVAREIKRFKRSSLDVSTGDDPIPRSQILLDKKGTQNHRMIAPPTFHACGEGRQLVVTEHMLPVPLYRTRKESTSSSSIDIYFTVVEKVNSSNKTFFSELGVLSPEKRAAEYVEDANLQDADDMMIFLQGGPGFGAPVPVADIGLGKCSSWAAAALDQYSRVVLMDQRGTGKSSPITKQSLERLFPDLFLLDISIDSSSKSLEELASSDPEDAKKVKDSVTAACDFLTQFRADSIVEDAEAIKDALLHKGNPGPRPWGCALGQSFGGFCLMTYLSKMSNPPRICLFTGGIAPMLTPVHDVYSSLWDRVKERNLRYYDMYPGDISIVKLIVKSLLDEPVPLPSGGLLTARRFLQLGIALGGSSSSFAKFHSMLSSAFLDSDDDELEFKRSFLKIMDSNLSYDDSPFYFWLHESIYANGPENSPTNWVADQAYENLKKTNKEFDYRHTSSLKDSSQPTLFFGEQVFPWMPEDFQELAGVGLKALANELAAKKDWGTLYDGNHMKKVLSDGSCTAAAAVYYEDMYVDFNASMKVVARGNPLEKCKVWVTNEYQHSGVRDDGGTIFSKLHNMATGSARVPS